MRDLERARQRQRDAGLARIGTWTRRSVAAGVVVSGAMIVGFANLLPGQAADEPAVPAQPPTARSAGPEPSSGTDDGRPKARKHHRLAPPDTPPASPAPLPTQPHTTSGGS